jgi:hypothetical protein
VSVRREMSMIRLTCNKLELQIGRCFLLNLTKTDLIVLNDLMS